MATARITGLTIYPVKSMRGIALDHASLTPLGLEHDRRFMVVRKEGRFVTQRDVPRLALIHTRLQKNGIELSMRERGTVLVPFEQVDGEPIQTAVWGDECRAVDTGGEISEWLTSALDSPEQLRLVRMATGYVRPQGKPDELGESTHTVFADAAPYLVANEVSLEALNRELVLRGYDAVPMNRFRPNIVLRGLNAFEEHRVSEVAAEGYRLRFCHPCQRCVVTTIDQQTAVKHTEWQPYKTLRDINPMPGNERAPAFGHNAVLESGEGQTISVGETVSLSLR